LSNRTGRPHGPARAVLKGRASRLEEAALETSASPRPRPPWRTWGSSFFQGEVRELAAGADPPLVFVLIDAEAIGDIDVTSAAMFEDLRTELAGMGVGLGLARIDQRVRDMLTRTGFLERLGTDDVFPTVRGGVEALRARAAAPGERS